MVTRWGLVLHLDAAPADATPDGDGPWTEPLADATRANATRAGDVPMLLTTDHLFEQARRAYLDRCPVLGAFLRSESAVVRVAEGSAAAERPAAATSDRDPAVTGGLLAVSVVEVRPSSFDMAVRIRPADPDRRRRADVDPARHPINGRWTLVLERIATGERLPVPREVRDELIAIQLAARDLC